MSRFRLHYKNKPYRLIGTAWHSETQEPLALYECLYPNDLGSLWVRPREMFFGDIETEGRKVPRFREVPLEISVFENVNELSWGRISGLVEKILPGTTREKLNERLKGKARVLLLVAAFEGDVVGFKLGYDAGDGFFESWLGGCREDRRGLGVGRELMVRQHDWARENGYVRIRTKTLGSWPEMLMLNLRSGFEIVGSEPSERGVKLLLEKSLEARP